MPAADIHACPCCTPRAFSRRGFIQAAAVGAAGIALAPAFAFAAPKNYEAMVLSCIDPRTQEGVRRAMLKRRLIGKYSQIVIAGASIGVVAPAFQGWHKTFWDNLDASVQLHGIKRVIAIDHRDCGAAKIAYGEERYKSRDDQTAIHRTSLAEFRKQCKDKQPKLGIETGLISLDGRLEMFA